MPQQRMNIVMPPDQTGGVYADFVQIWHNKDIFTLDFSALTAPPQLNGEEGGEPVLEMNAQVVARIRVPPSQVFEIMRAMEHQLSDWEAEQRRTPGGDG